MLLSDLKKAALDLPLGHRAKFIIGSKVLAEALVGDGNLVCDELPIPSDAKLSGFYFDQALCCDVIELTSPHFPPIAEGAEVPRYPVRFAEFSKPCTISAEVSELPAGFEIPRGHTITTLPLENDRRERIDRDVQLILAGLQAFTRSERIPSPLEVKRSLPDIYAYAELSKDLAPTTVMKCDVPIGRNERGEIASIGGATLVDDRPAKVVHQRHIDPADIPRWQAIGKLARLAAQSHPHDRGIIIAACDKASHAGWTPERYEETFLEPFLAAGCAYVELPQRQTYFWNKKPIDYHDPQALESIPPTISLSREAFERACELSGIAPPLRDIGLDSAEWAENNRRGAILQLKKRAVAGWPHLRASIVEAARFAMREGWEAKGFRFHLRNVLGPAFDADAEPRETVQPKLLMAFNCSDPQIGEKMQAIVASTVEPATIAPPAEAKVETWRDRPSLL